MLLEAGFERKKADVLVAVIKESHNGLVTGKDLELSETHIKNHVWMVVSAASAFIVGILSLVFSLLGQ